jgi:hypothetical protein
MLINQESLRWLFKEKYTFADVSDADIVKQIEEVCTEEATIKEKRQALMYPSGAPL